MWPVACVPGTLHHRIEKNHRQSHGVIHSGDYYYYGLSGLALIQHAGCHVHKHDGPGSSGICDCKRSIALVFSVLQINHSRYFVQKADGLRWTSAPELTAKTVRGITRGISFALSAVRSSETSFYRRLCGSPVEQWLTLVATYRDRTVTKLSPSGGRDGAMLHLALSSMVDDCGLITRFLNIGQTIAYPEKVHAI